MPGVDKLVRGDEALAAFRQGLDGPSPSTC